MRSSFFSFLSFVMFAALAQTPGTFRGRMIDADTGQPTTDDVTIVVTKEGASDATRRTFDVKGEFTLPDMTPGRYRIQFRYKGIQSGTMRYVQVTDPPAATPADIYVRIPGEIRGVIRDEDGEPVQGAQVMVVTPEYGPGQMTYRVFTTARATDDRGRYSITSRVETGLPYLMLVLPPDAGRPTLSGTPSVEPIWYPGRPGFAQPFVMRSAEKMERDFVMEKKKTYCVDGTLTGNGQPAAKGFEIAIPEISGYRQETGGTQGVVVRGQSDASGHFQACGLWPGEYVLAAGINKMGGDGVQVSFKADSYGRMSLSVVDRDVHDVKLNTRTEVGMPNAEIRWDGTETPPQNNRYRLQFVPLNRVAFEAQPFLAMSMDVVVPSKFQTSLLPSTDYRVSVGRFDGSTDWYLKDVTCGGTVTRNVLKLAESDCGLVITVGTDAGKLTAKVVDKDNKDDLNSLVCIAAASAVTREDIALTGSCTPIEAGTTSATIPLRPDRYFALPMTAAVADWVEYFLANRGQGTPIEIKPKASAQLTLKSK
jgi:hypothetical protein